MPHQPWPDPQEVTAQDWGRWAEQATTGPTNPVEPETATQLSQRLDDLYVRYIALRNEREAREQAELDTWLAHEPTTLPYSDNYVRFREAMIANAAPAPRSVFQYLGTDMADDPTQDDLPTVKKSKGRVFNRRWRGGV